MQVRALSMAVVRRRPWWQGVAVWLAAAGFVLAAPLARAQMYFDVAGGPITAVPNMVGPAIVGASMGSYIDRAERGKERSAGRTAAPPARVGPRRPRCASAAMRRSPARRSSSFARSCCATTPARPPASTRRWRGTGWRAIAVRWRAPMGWTPPTWRMR